MRIGITFGVWDVTHYGHIFFLMRARKIVDKLIVGVCSDELNEKVKGRKPYQSQKTRKWLVRQIRGVDEAFIYGGFDYSKHFKEFGANVLIIGPEFGKKDVPGHVAVMKIAPEICMIPRTSEISSTEIRNALDNKSHIRLPQDS